jgi:sugar phosphate isomerase/epimerase
MTAGRLSLNQATTRHWTVGEAARGCAEAGIPGIGLWRDAVAAAGAQRAARLVRAAGLTVTSLCRGGFLTGPGKAARAAALDDNRRAIDEAATVGAPVLVLVCGGLPAGSRDLPGAAGGRPRRAAGDRADAPDVLRGPVGRLHG